MFGVLVIELPALNDDGEGSDQRRKWSPEVARRSVDCFWEEAGSHSVLVTGKECVASAILTYSNPCWGPSGVLSGSGSADTRASKICICPRI